MSEGDERAARSHASRQTEGSTLTVRKCTLYNLNFSVSEYCQAVNRPLRPRFVREPCFEGWPEKEPLTIDGIKRGRLVL